MNLPEHELFGWKCLKKEIEYFCILSSSGNGSGPREVPISPAPTKDVFVNLSKII